MWKKLLCFVFICILALSVASNMMEDDENMEDLDDMKPNGTDTGMDTPAGDSDDMGSEDNDAAAEGEVSEDEASADEADVDDMSKKSVKNFTCKVTGAILSMAESIKELNNDIKDIKNQMFEKCPGFNASKTESVDIADSVDALNATDDKTNLEENAEEGAEGEKEEVLPPIPTECDAPFQPVANSCYYFLYYPPDWKTWGDANAYCQTFGGTLAAPYRYDDLRKYLINNFSNVFWVGAKKSATKDVFEWLTSRELAEGDWKEGNPSKSAAKFCVYLESTSGYKATNHYCGEKFSFVCEKRVEVE